MRSAVEQLAPMSRRPSREPPPIEPLAHPVDALAFVNDPATAAVLGALFGATGQGRVQFGGLAAAMQVLQSAPCPQLLVIDIAGVADPLGHLDRLADFCPPGTAVVLVGNSNDPTLLHELDSMGVAHYLIKPVDPERMRDAIETALGAVTSTPHDPFGAGQFDPGAPSPAPPLNGHAVRREMPSAIPAALHQADPFSGRPAPPPVGQPAGAFAADPFMRTPPAPLRYEDPRPAPADPFSAGRTADPFSASRASEFTAPANGAVAANIASAMASPMAAPVGSLASPFPSAPIDVEPLPRPVDLLSFLTEAGTAALVSALLGPQAAAGRIQPGGIAGAIAFLKDNASPKVLLIDISGVSEPMARIDALAEVCAPGTIVIALGQANDVSLYRDLKAAGIFEYLVKPLAPETLKNAILSAVSGGVKGELEVTKPTMMVIGSRGGVGASTVAINLAGALAKQGKKTILLDLDLQFGSIALTLDIDPGHGLREALDRPERVDSMFLNSSAVKVAEDLYVLAAEEGVNETVEINVASLDTLLVELSRHFDAIVIDMPRHVAAGNWATVGRAHGVLLIGDLSLVGIRDTSRMLAAAKEAIDPGKLKLMIGGSSGDRGAKIDRKEFESALNRKADYVLPDDAKVVSAANRAGRTVPDVAPGSKLAVSLAGICKEMLGPPPEEAGKEKRRGGLFRRRKRA